MAIGFCPILSAGREDTVDCMEDECHWWKNNKCVVQRIYDELSSIYSNIPSDSSTEISSILREVKKTNSK